MRKEKLLTKEEQTKLEVMEFFKPEKNKIFLKCSFKTRPKRKCNERPGKLKRLREDEIYFYKLKRIMKEELYKAMKGDYV